jgi:hypothetical protein
MPHCFTPARWAAAATAQGVRVALVYGPAPCPHGHRPDPDWVPGTCCPHCLTDIERRHDCSRADARAWIEASGTVGAWLVGRRPQDPAHPRVALDVASIWQILGRGRSYTLHSPTPRRPAAVRIRQGRWHRVVLAPDGDLARALATALWVAWQAFPAAEDGMPPATRVGSPGPRVDWLARVARWLSRPVF